MQPPANYQQYPPNYQQQYPPNFQQPNPGAQKSGGTSILAIIALGVAVVALILSLLFGLDAFTPKPVVVVPEFNVQNFAIKTTSTDYTSYSWMDYEGTGDVVTTSTDSDYLVIVKVTLVSGGTSGKERETYQLVNVINGTGKLYTYDYGDTPNISEPNYDFAVVGYIPVSK